MRINLIYYSIMLIELVAEQLQTAQFAYNNIIDEEE